MPLPQYDVLGSMSAGTASGLAIANAIGANQDRALRRQELQSQMALQRLQQAQLAQKMTFDLQAHDMMINEQADMAKAMAKVQAESVPTIAAPPEIADLGYDTVPNPVYKPLDQSLMQNVLPVVAKYRPQEVDNFVSGVAMLPYRQAEAKRQEALAAKDLATAKAGPKPLSSIGKMQADREMALQNGDYEAAKEIDDAIAKQHATAASDVQKMVDEHKKQTGRDFTPDEVDKLYRIKMGLDPKAAVVQPVTFEQFATKHLSEFMDNPRHFDPKTKKLRRPQSHAEAMADMKSVYDSMQDHIKGMPKVEGAVTPTPITEEEKVIIIDPQGRKFKLPKSQLEDALKQGYKEYEG